MPPALTGALVGLAIGVLLYIFEYVVLTKQSKERAVKLHRKPEFDQTERNRLSTVLRFNFILPLLFAAGFWLVSLA